VDGQYGGQGWEKFAKEKINGQRSAIKKY